MTLTALWRAATKVGIHIPANSHYPHPALALFVHSLLRVDERKSAALVAPPSNASRQNRFANLARHLANGSAPATAAFLSILCFPLWAGLQASERPAQRGKHAGRAALQNERSSPRRSTIGKSNERKQKRESRKGRANYQRSH